ncbi:VOC family protein [Martelella alba]|uniref:VOC family protein n=1 Tax=Martelella alba TaxID=2590451 RepID=A0ABY2SLI0_9HYPH|nr:VOC family protein [Martelella alba]TKI05888.1 VOC family protein [Martelella alba]
MITLQRIHHIAIIASDYPRSKRFYCQTLGFTLINEHFRAERQSWKGDLALNGDYLIELFSFPSAPPRVSRPEALGLRHLAFGVASVDEARDELLRAGVAAEPVRTDPLTGKRFTFFSDPDGLPLELYEL